MKILAIVLNTFKENIRDRILYNLLIFALILIGMSIYLGTLTIGEQVKLTTDLGLFCISLFGVLMAIFLGIQLVFKEIDRKTIYSLIAKPVPRYQFLLGKYLGQMLTILVNVTIMSVAYIAVLYYMKSKMTWALVQALILIVLELSIITSIALLFSSFSTPTLSAIFTLSCFVVGRLVEHIKFLGLGSDNPMIKNITKFVYYIIPNLKNFIPLQAASYNQPLEWTLFLQCLMSGLLWTAVFLIIAMVVFQRRDFV